MNDAEREGASPSAADPLAQLDASEQASLVARGELSAGELVEAACRRIERVDGLLGAVPIRLFDEAIELARSGESAPGPFAGVPFLMKDVGARQAGQPYYAANRALMEADHRAAADTPLGARFRRVGLVTVGKSSAPEFGLQSNTWPLVYGPTRNPWDPRRAAGGSSGGACAAVAAGLVPVAHASDGAGSIRIPAAWCGLVGLKPTRDRVVWRHAGKGRPDVEFVVARSLRDTAALLDALRADVRSARAGEFGAALERPVERLRIGVLTEAPGEAAVDPDCRALVLEWADRASDAGHFVEAGGPASLCEYAERALHGAVLGPIEYRACLDELEERLGRAAGPGDVEPYLWELSQLAVGTSPAAAAAAMRWNEAWVARTLSFFEDCDVLLTPTVAEPAPLLEALDPERHDPLALLEKMVPHMAFTEPWNATGQPALTLPLGRTRAGLPIGLQLVGRRGAEARLIGLAAELLARSPEASRARPPIHA
ncbi:MAG: amidase [Myxococcales bacterium]|nr:amidase [Myxococcales bacterium]